MASSRLPKIPHPFLTSHIRATDPLNLPILIWSAKSRLEINTNYECSHSLISTLKRLLIKTIITNCSSGNLTSICSFKVYTKSNARKTTAWLTNYGCGRVWQGPISQHRGNRLQKRENGTKNSVRMTGL